MSPPSGRNVEFQGTPRDTLAALRRYVARLRSVAKKYCGRRVGSEIYCYTVTPRRSGPPMIGSVASVACHPYGYGASSIVAGLVGDDGWPAYTATKARNRLLEAGRVADDGTVFYVNTGELRAYVRRRG